MLNEFLAEYGYYAVFLLLVLSGIGLPISEELLLFSSGVIVLFQGYSLWLTIFISFIAILIGDSLTYAAGYFLKDRFHQSKWLKKRRKYLFKAEKYFQRFGKLAILFARLIPGMRLPVFFFAGTSSSICFGKFLLLVTISAVINVPIVVYLGYISAENHQWLLDKLHQFKTFWMILLVLFLGFLALSFWRNYQKRRLRFNRLKKQRNLRNKNISRI